MAAWQLAGDAVACGNLRLAWQRLARSHWQPQGVLRSWGLVPLHREADALFVPCADDEVLWLGAWLESVGPGTPGDDARVTLGEGTAGPVATMQPPHQFQITALGDTDPAPLGRTGAPTRRYRIGLRCGVQTEHIDCVLLPPADWAARARRPAPPPLAGPPPLPPRLG